MVTALIIQERKMPDEPAARRLLSREITVAPTRAAKNDWLKAKHEISGINTLLAMLEKRHKVVVQWIFGEKIVDHVNYGTAGMADHVNYFAPSDTFIRTLMNRGITLRISGADWGSVETALAEFERERPKDDKSKAAAVGGPGPNAGRLDTVPKPIAPPSKGPF